MPVTPTYPGVYIEEVSSGVHPITGVATSIAAFVGFARRGPVNEPTTVQSFAEFTRTFGGLWSASTMSQAVSQFFLNGGSQALIVRTAHLGAGGTQAKKGKVAVGDRATKLNLEAANEGEWSANLLVRIDYDTSDQGAVTPVMFNLSIKDTSTDVVEVLRNLTPGPTLPTRHRPAVAARPRCRAAADGAPGGTRGGGPRRRPVSRHGATPTQFTPFPARGRAAARRRPDEADVVPAPGAGTGM